MDWIETKEKKIKFTASSLITSPTPHLRCRTYDSNCSRQRFAIRLSRERSKYISHVKKYITNVDEEENMLISPLVDGYSEGLDTSTRYELIERLTPMAIWMSIPSSDSYVHCLACKGH